MGYESMIYVVQRKEHISPDGEIRVFPVVIAEYDLCCVGYDAVHEIFDREIDYSLWLPGCDRMGNEVMESRVKDEYGEHMKYTSLPTLIAALMSWEEEEHYRRFPPLIAMLEAFADHPDEWPGLQAVHFGY